MKYFKVSVRRTHMIEVFIACARDRKHLEKSLPSFFKHLEIGDDVSEIGILPYRPIKYQGVTMFDTTT